MQIKILSKKTAKLMEKEVKSKQEKLWLFERSRKNKVKSLVTKEPVSFFWQKSAQRIVWQIF